MPYRNVLAILLSTDEAQVLRAAELAAGKQAGRVTGLYMFEMPMPVMGDGIGLVTLWPRVVEQARADAAGAQERIEKQLLALEASNELRTLECTYALAGEVAAQQAMHADLAVLQAPQSDFASAVFEGALFASGRPVLLVPKSWNGRTVGENILIAWKPKREAARAVADAAAFIDSAKSVTILTVDAVPDDSGAGPGRDIALHLARDGAKVDVRNVDGQGRSAEFSIVDEAKAIGADLIVMGGYGNGRLMEFVLGGVTRSLSRDCPVPILMSH